LDDDRERVQSLWTAPARAYFDGPDDPDVVALAFDVTGGRWWDGPDSRIGQSLALARAIVTHDASKVGEVGAVATGTPPASG
jgi:general stress protein 26